jgi:hypothetical protein
MHMAGARPPSRNSDDTTCFVKSRSSVRIRPSAPLFEHKSVGDAPNVSVERIKDPRESARLTLKAGSDSSLMLLGVRSAAAIELNRSSQ